MLGERERLPTEVRAILREQEMAGERLVNYVRGGFALFAYLALWLTYGAQSHAADVIYTIDSSLWLLYVVFAFVLLRRRRVYGWLKYVSISVDITVLFVGMI